MAGESTNNPEGMGSNPGRPSLNDQGIGQPNYAPPPPSSAIGSPNAAEANKALDEFFERLKDLEKSTDSFSQAIENQKTIYDQAAKAAVAKKEAEVKADREREQIERKYSKYKDAEGKWYKGSEPFRKQYEEGLQSISKELKVAVDAEKAARKAIRDNDKVLKAEQRSRQDAIAAMEKMVKTVDDFDVSTGISMSIYLDTATMRLNEMKGKVNEGLDEIKKQAETVKKSGLAEILARENAKAMSEAIVKAEREVKASRLAAGEQRESAVSAAAMGIGRAGGIVGLSEIKAEIDAITAAEMARFKAMNPEATEQEAEAHRKKSIEQSKTIIQERLIAKQQKEMLELKRKQIETIAREKGVSMGAATALAAMGAEGQEAALVQSRHEQTLAALQKLDSGQLVLIEQMKTEDAKAAERAAEAVNDVPAWAQELIDGYNMGNAFLKDMFSGIFRKEEGWFKTIILLLTVTIGATVGYIYNYIQRVFAAIKWLTGGVPVLGRLFSGIGSGVGGLMSKIGSGFLAVEGGLMALVKGIPFVGQFLSFFPRVLSALRIGFNFASKFFLPLQILISTIDGIIGAFKGFKQLGIRGAIIGAVSQIISGLTFGLLDFQILFDFFNKTLGGFVDAIVVYYRQFYNVLIKPFVDAFMNIIEIFRGSGNIFSKILKSLVEVFLAQVKFLVGKFIQFSISLPILLLKAVFYTLKFFYYDIPMLLADAGMWVWNWITSGVWIDDLLSFGEWLHGKLVGFFTDIINSIADALGEIPIVGSRIKSALGGGTPTPPPTPTSASRAATIVTSPSGGVQVTAMTSPMSFGAPAIMGAATTASSAQYLAQNRGVGSVVNAPTTNIVGAGGGGGGGGAVLMPRTSRNNDPTFRALLFQEAPAL